MIFFIAPFAALGMAASVLAALPAAIYVSAMTRGRTRGPRCPACDELRCAECVRLDAERERRFGRRG